MYSLVPTGDTRLDLKAADGNSFPIEELYFCDTCSKIRSRFELSEEIDSYYCPNCLENMPSSEAMIYLNRCSKCFECPVCFNTLIIIAPPEGGCIFSCQYCRWSSKNVQMQHERADQLCVVQHLREREHIVRKTMSKIVGIYRKASQELARERELMARMRRRSITIFLPVILQNPVRRPEGPWKPEDIERILAEREEKSRTFLIHDRAKEGVICHFEPLSELVQMPDPHAAPPPPPVESTATEQADLSKDVFAAVLVAGTTAASGMNPRDNPLSASTASQAKSGRGGADEKSKDKENPLLRFQYIPKTRAESLKEMKASLDTPLVNVASLDQRLAALNDGLQDIAKAFPCRKAMATKRSRRCRECQKLLIKPQISPCSTPPFPQRHNIALFFIPKLFLLHPPRIERSREAEVHLAIINPLYSVLSVKLDPTNILPADEENSTLEVLLPPYETLVAPFSHMNEIQEGLGDEDEDANALKEIKDDPSLVYERRYNRLVLLVKVRTKVETEVGDLATAAMGMKLEFKDRHDKAKSHSVETTVTLTLGKVHRRETTDLTPSAGLDALCESPRRP
uniref:Dynactin subunit 4 n=1 Tax=Chromera velia CCMP2878 TaxID=1169474 RepID=A0A0G4I7E4_9ALVE|eukprot:Cvel_11590.t1-p1 / transcript=Cvel_11590.t1 / gene=Cvel_11590 / organism=Chromera_velia_CCMP2878 / gene_product=Dynactin subunit 4, putative / transcript_product=Dynactin subunit 4, putative / location=Cvel_scaffold733:36094-43670(-) / protein_length=569 / sequence_SO=supercontig / SO=protein_coding / is_pseudo=false